MVAVLVGVPAVLLVVAGAAKLVDPSRTAGALAALGWPSSPVLVRVGAAAELMLGSIAIAYGGPLAAGLVAASYVGFTVFVVAALRSGKPIGTCGCLGRVDTRPSVTHVAINVTLAACAGWAAAFQL